MSINSQAFSKVACVDSINSQLKSLKLTPKKLVQFTVNKKNNPVYSSRTNKFGTWLMVQEKNKLIQLDILNSQNIKSIEFEIKSCKVVGNKTKKIKNSTRGLTDKKLHRLIKKNRKGIIYVWSPGNAYSFKAYHKHLNIAKKLKLKWTPIMAKKSSKRNITNLKNYVNLPKEAYKRLNAVELKMRGATIHTPATFLYKNGKLLETKLIGVYEPKIYKREILSILKN